MPYKDPQKARENARERSRRYRERHKDKIKEYNYNYYHKNKETELKRSKQYRIDNPDYDKQWYHKHRDERLDSVKKLQREKKYQKLHTKTYNFIKKHNLYPDECCLCWSNKSIEAHHPDYSKWYEVIFICHKCHQNIHVWNIKCLKPINLLDLVPPFNSNNNSKEWE